MQSYPRVTSSVNSNSHCGMEVHLRGEDFVIYCPHGSTFHHEHCPACLMSPSTAKHWKSLLKSEWLDAPLMVLASDGEWPRLSTCFKKESVLPYLGINPQTGKYSTRYLPRIRRLNELVRDLAISVNDIVRYAKMGILGTILDSRISPPILPDLPAKKSRYNSNSVPGVYLIKTDGGLCKIGCSANVCRRVYSIQHAIPHYTEHIHTIRAQDFKAAESLLHTRFAAKREKLEWFRLDDEDIESLKSISAFTDGNFL